MTTQDALMLNPNVIVPLNLPQARRRRKVLRRLLENKRTEQKVGHFHVAFGGDQKKPLLKWAYLAIAIVAAVSLALKVTGNMTTVSEFLKSYKNQYHSIVHNQDNYCNPAQRLGDMVLHARHQVLNQDKALDQLELALDNTKEIIVLVGTSGVGKSHTARILRENFPWPENVKTLSWSGHRSLRRVKSMLPDLTFCGQHLILIDNMTPKDAQFVPAINQLINEGEKIANLTEHPHQKQLTVVLIFSVNGMQAGEAFEMDMVTLRNMPHIHVITYATLESTHLVDCIRREAAIAMVQLEDEHVDEIIRSIDASASGCKSVLAKVLLYGKPIIDESQETN
ncbi:uncharacterized protein LOC6550045 isoform X1 [Drosophila erecta]|uniref:AAA+ ATPase domain-containing protein n=1 Tax=Drosophila erecta TaxID=7220 RepID=B3NW99_DROER|nr:uncharacterized protein LOC6550045 isoform X1 [Drosophila erecta]EDV46438.1 uncharacterized protein Dere_GG19088 [Drosophila erecta]